jgi:hypothetical protein
MRDWLAELWMRMRRFRDDRDLKDELQAHMEMLADDESASGVSPGEASRRARVTLGNADVVVAKIRDQEFATLVELWFRDFILAFRILRKSPLFCLTAILTLAVGIGANTAVFTLLYGLLLRSLPVPNPHQLARIKMYGPTHRPPWSAKFRIAWRSNFAKNSAPLLTSPRGSARGLRWRTPTEPGASSPST